MNELYYTDFHIHSRYSRATSKTLDLELLAAWAEVKGIAVVATGDCLHGAWLEAIEEKLEPDGSGFLTLCRPESAAERLAWYPGAIAGTARFILSTEISSIYKKNGRVRKIHNLVYLPTLEAAKALRERLGKIGNLDSDGRPILGLDSQDLLAMVLDIHADAFLVPAHVWTPWFSLFGSQSGFDHIEECFGPLASEIFALETGLSSDPDMNWLVSSLDRFQLISNSDAHSGEKLGREANRFAGAMDFSALRGALSGTSSRAQFLGTVEFFPEEGKYHLDGHRACQVVLSPRQTKELQGICPQCGKPLTLGVLHRVFQLADRDEPQQPAAHPGFVSVIPLAEIVSEVLGVGAASKRVQEMYARAIAALGPELPLLLEVPESDLRQFHPLLGEAISRMRQGNVVRTPGYDGQYGRIHTLTAEDRVRFGPVAHDAPRRSRRRREEVERSLQDAAATQSTNHAVFPNAEQHAAIAASGPVLVSAGPGTGKTHTLVAQVLALAKQGVPLSQILVVTFTRKAAQELRERLRAHLGNSADLVQADTLHAAAWASLEAERVLLADDEARAVFAAAHPELSGRALRDAYAAMQRGRETLSALPDPAYTARKELLGVWDYTDLLENWLEALRQEKRPPYTHVLVDEAQDLSPLQWRIIGYLAREDGSGVFLIGDADQSIYGFRGSAPLEEAARALWPGLQVVRLTQNYRSAPQILRAAAPFSCHPMLQPVFHHVGEVRLGSFAHAEQEARWIASTIAAMVGQSGHWQMDGKSAAEPLALEDVAVLVRAQSLMPPVETALREAGVPVYRAEGEPMWNHPGVRMVLDTARQALAGELEMDAGTLAGGPPAVVHWLHAQGRMPQASQSSPMEELAARYREAGSWERLLSQLQLDMANHAVFRAAQKVPLLTIHGAKGLEFHTVFVPCLEDGLLPWAESPEDEEMRIFYVALTRAKRRLVLTSSRQRRLWGKVQTMAPSRFLSQIPSDVVRLVDERTKVVSRQLVFP